ncbi:MAG: hypothetical protein A2X78_04025 [Gammaproteobacteria bacterium GWE2_37_16]|nr:MAG: hypothetical protein A2X78_04025 [Gammaproteobacteria bacterium GWE2_37_16]
MVKNVSSKSKYQIIDFKEVTYEDFEACAKAILRNEGMNILTNPNRGADDGVDFFVEEKNPRCVIKWLVSVKHNATTENEKAVSHNDEKNLRDRIEQHEVHGFMGFYSTVISSGLEKQFQTLKKQGKQVYVYDKNEIVKLLLESKNSAVFEQYFPHSYSVYRQKEKKITNDQSLLPIGNFLLRKVDDIVESIVSKKSNHLSTGFYDLDEVTGGLHKDDFFIVAGRPLVGVIDFILNIASYAAIKDKKNTAFFNLSQSTDDILRRILSSLGHIEHTKIDRSYLLVDADWARLTSAVSLSFEMPFCISNNMNFPLDELYRYLVDNKFELVVIDNLQHLFWLQHKIQNMLTIEQLCHGLKEFSRKFHIPIIAGLTVLSDLEKRIDKRPLLTDLGDWQVLEEIANIITFIYDDHLYNDSSPDNGISEIIIAKNTHGDRCKIRLAYIPQHSHFCNYSNKCY